ncbi:ORF6N domain-containing protein [Luteibaculum oceani]|uniref:ORF6N domain-containing protein n=1 Tax=Luteibaculum oceani TaxID=1294296 RepID=A0A5C6V8U9_9FLAO|nr:ORF6N domain-containing protein [Luteibaculum oceani]TXC81487.1 ORF6N domain-containing protein [Luteibaculum oceani]
MKTSSIVPQEIISEKIYLIREQKVMIDSDLAELYQVPTKRLNEQVKRNRERFPADFMFQLNQFEWNHLKSQTATSSSRWGGRRSLPYVFTEHGILMLSSVLTSERAMSVNIQIMRIFVRIRSFLNQNETLLRKIRQMEKNGEDRDHQIKVIFDWIRKIESNQSRKKDSKPRVRIGFKI